MAPITYSLDIGVAWYVRPLLWLSTVAARLSSVCYAKAMKGLTHKVTP